MNIDFSNSNIKQNYYYNNFNQGINVKKTNPIKKDTFELSKSKKDYSLDDGKISFSDKLKNFGKGLISPITSLFSSKKNFVIGLGMIAIGGLLIAATGGAAAPVMVSLGVAGGAAQFAVSAFKAAKAKTDDEAKLAWQGMGSGTSAVAMSVIGSKKALKPMGTDTSNMGYLKATVECFKQSPKGISKSVSAFTSGEALNNIKATLRIKTPSKEEKSVEPKKTEEIAAKEQKLIEQKEPLESSNQKVENQYKLSSESIKKGSRYLAEEGTPEYDALSQLVEKEYVVVKNKDEVFQIFKNEHNSLGLSSSDDVYVLNSSDAVKAANKKIGTSNAYMSDWYAEANGLQGKVVNQFTIQEAVLNSKSDVITIIVPDDCAITGRSMIVDTAKILSGIDVPEGKSIKLVFSPMIESTSAKTAFSATSAMDLDGLASTKILNTGDKEVMSLFFDKYTGKLTVSTPSNIIETRPYYQSEYFINLKNENPELAQTVEAILTSNGTAGGYGRPGTSGVMIATPSADGVTLKCPNNNVYGAAPYALSEGASYDTIKRPGEIINGVKTCIAKWHNILKEMKETVNDVA